jgi:hypothetical protein
LSSLGNALGQENRPPLPRILLLSRRPGNGRLSAPTTPTPSTHRARYPSPLVTLSKHSVADEQAPESRFPGPDFQKAFSDARTATVSLARVLGVMLYTSGLIRSFRISVASPAADSGGDNGQDSRGGRQVRSEGLTARSTSVHFPPTCDPPPLSFVDFFTRQDNAFVYVPFVQAPRR